MIFKTRVACARKTASCVYTILKKNLNVVCCWLIINYISPHDLHNEQLCYKLAAHLSTRRCPCSRAEMRRSHIGDLEYHKDRESCHSQVTLNQANSLFWVREGHPWPLESPSAALAFSFPFVSALPQFCWNIPFKENSRWKLFAEKMTMLKCTVILSTWQAILVGGAALDSLTTFLSGHTESSAAGGVPIRALRK